MSKRQSLVNLLLVMLLTGCSFGPGAISTPTSTALPGILPTSTISQAVTSTITPTPEARVHAGEKAFGNGDYDLALTEFQFALQNSPDPAIRAAALWGLGRVQHLLGSDGQALTSLWLLSSQYPASPNAIRAYFLMGDIYMTLERFSEAAEAYTIYLALRPGIIDSFVHERRGDAFLAAGNYAEAISAFQAALNAAHLADDTSLKIKLAGTYEKSGDSVTALGMYDAIAKASSDDYLKAQMDLFSGRLHMSLGQADQAYQHYLNTVENYPLAADSYPALVVLVNDNIPVDDLARGLVDYFSGQYGYALDAFQRYIAAVPGNDGTANYYRAMSLRKIGQFQQAVEEFTSFINNFPENRYWQSAWAEKADTLWFNMNEYEAATQTLFAFVQQAPMDLNAPVYLMEAARIQERYGTLEDAAATWERVGSEYPGSDLVPQALFWAGIVRYRLGNFDKALVTFQRDAILSTSTEDQARAYFWIGKSQLAVGDLTSAQSTWQQTAALDPTDFYSLRAQDILLNRPLFTSSPTLNFNPDLAAERKDAESWLRVTFGLAADTSLADIGELSSDERLVRGTELMTLGQERAATHEFEALQAAVEQDPANCFRLANYLLDLGLYNPAVFTIRQVLTLAGMTTQTQTLAAPPYINHFRYGLYYRDLIFSAAQQTGLDPLLLFSLMRQESLYDKNVGSTQGALGLMQITPARGQLIVDGLGWPPNYSAQDLYRPLVNINLSAFHLRDVRLSSNGNLFAALAGYNAGPDTAPIWLALSNSDPDLFVEVVRYEETRSYIRSIYEIFAMYQRLYETNP